MQVRNVLKAGEMASDFVKASNDVTVADRLKSIEETLEEMEYRGELYKGWDSKERCHRKNRNTKHKKKMKKASRKKNRR